jgi:hypothetical protein
MSINSKTLFTLDEAQEVLPVIWRITNEANTTFQRLSNQLERSRDAHPDKAISLDREIEELVAAWKLKLRKLGVSPKGLWLADFDNGTGYFCWKFPERQLSHWHGYQDGFLGRRPLGALTELRP